MTAETLGAYVVFQTDWLTYRAIIMVELNAINVWDEEINLDTQQMGHD